MRTVSGLGRAALACAFGLLALALLPATPASAGYSRTTLYSFCKKVNCKDGALPQAALVMDSSGNLYGTAAAGGANASGSDGGVVFELVHNQDGTFTYKTLHSFCAVENCADGDQPLSDLILDTNGNLYGTTWFGGKGGAGAVFELSKNSGAWTEKVIYSFCLQTNCPDGDTPPAGLTYAGQSTGARWDGSSALFGTTFNGGKYDHGVAYKLAKSGTSFTQTVIHNFNTSIGPGPLAMDSAGNLFGATVRGAQYGGGLFFELAHDTWAETVLYRFCSVAPNCADGTGYAGYPARPVIDSAGNIFSVASGGGTGTASGVAYELTKSGSGYSYNIVYKFCADATYCRDGLEPNTLVMDSSGDLFGTTQQGGKYVHGVAFKLHKAGGSWSETVLYNFCRKTNCRDGAKPWAGVILDGQGHLFGTTQHGGTNNDNGTVFELSP